jgi:hypothetical protein
VVNEFLLRAPTGTQGLSGNLFKILFPSTARRLLSPAIAAYPPDTHSFYTATAHARSEPAGGGGNRGAQLGSRPRERSRVAAEGAQQGRGRGSAAGSRPGRRLPRRAGRRRMRSHAAARPSHLRRLELPGKFGGERCGFTESVKGR